jgi:anhydro-N-acetylmuramic acid kinase
VDDDLLQHLLTDPFLQRAPPKSTGREYYNLAWLAEFLKARTCAPVDVQRTLLEFTARSIQQALQNWGPDCRRMIICGGGRLNPLLRSRLAALCAVPVETSESHGFDGDAIEAGAFAWLARQRLILADGSAASVTGATGDRVLGALYPGAEKPK